MIHTRFLFTDSEKYLEISGTYSEKWSLLMHAVMSVTTTKKTYECLSLVKKAYRDRNFLASDVIEELLKVNEDAARKLLDAAPLYDISPYDLKCYILAVFGCCSTQELESA